MKKHKPTLLLYAILLFSLNGEEPQCSICMDTLSQRMLPYQNLPCHPNHNFHQSCIHPWLLKVSRCPLCRSKHRNPLRFGCLGCIIYMSYAAQYYAHCSKSFIVSVLEEIEKDLERANNAHID